jgi:hypothetical protein
VIAATRLRFESIRWPEVTDFRAAFCTRSEIGNLWSGVNVATKQRRSRSGSVNQRRPPPACLPGTSVSSRSSAARRQTDRQRDFSHQLCSEEKWRRPSRQAKSFWRHQHQHLTLAKTWQTGQSDSTMAAGAVCRIGGDSHICRIFPKEGRFDFDEAMSIEGRICRAKVRPDTSAGVLSAN